MTDIFKSEKKIPNDEMEVMDIILYTIVIEGCIERERECEIKSRGNHLVEDIGGEMRSIQSATRRLISYHLGNT